MDGSHAILTFGSQRYLENTTTELLGTDSLSTLDLNQLSKYLSDIFKE